MNIFVPDLIRRRPRSICDHAHWKGINTNYVLYVQHPFTSHIQGSEFQGWLLWYSLPVLHGILPDPYYHHYSCFVASIGMLLEAHITSESLEKANALLETFCRKMSDLYGEYEYNNNIIHVPGPYIQRCFIITLYY